MVQEADVCLVLVDAIYGLPYETLAETPEAWLVRGGAGGVAQQLARELEAQIDELEERFDPAAEKLTTQSVRPRKADIEVRLVALAWCPFRRSGFEPAWSG